MYLLETEDLVHRFSSDELILDHIDLKISAGTIYGFLGPNGAGKTTTLKLILGLLKKQQGSISIFGKSLDENRNEILKKIGSLIETPSLYGHLTATENLLLLQKIYQCPKSRIEEVLKIVGLANTKNKKAKQFSLGMKQRLSIAIALLHQPPLLILDEPTNGLDPNGMIEIRALLKMLNEEYGITIVISSHLLSEIEKLVIDVGIISKGKIMFQGPLQDLLTRQRQSTTVVLETSDIPKTSEICIAHQFQSRVKNGKIEIDMASRENIALINRMLVQQGIDVYAISNDQNNLEMIFMDLINP